MEWISAQLLCGSIHTFNELKTNCITGELQKDFTNLDFVMNLLIACNTGNCGSYFTINFLLELLINETLIADIS